MSIKRTPTPLSPLQNRPVFRNSEQFERTPVGDRDKQPKIQLCIELRKKEVKKTKRTLKSEFELVLEVSVMYLKNLPIRQLGGKIKSSSSNASTFVKVRLIPGEIIHSTELKMDKQNKEKVDLDFIEVFGFPLNSTDDLKGKVMEVLVCDKKMTRNAFIFGQADIGVEDIQLGKPVCKWFTLTSETDDKSN